jgi:predicted nucleic acid-binding Zn finger protein
MKDHFWYDKYFGDNDNIVFYFGNGCGFRISISIGKENFIMIFGFCIGINFNG